MRTAIIGGGQGCRAILSLLVEGRLQELQLDVRCVVDPNPKAPGVLFARQKGWPHFYNLQDALNLGNLELIIELTGIDEILAEIYAAVPAGVKVMDHTMARVFWDLVQVEERLREELKKRDELERQILADRRRLQRVLDSLPNTVVVIDRHKQIVAVNARFTESTGLTGEQVVGEPCEQVLCRRYAAGGACDGECCFDEVMRTRRPTTHMHCEEDEDGVLSYYEITASPIFDADGRIVQLLETSRPVTEQVTLKRATEESEQRFRQFVTAAHDLIVMKNLERRYLVINPQAAALFKRQPEDFIGKTDGEVLGPRLARLMAAKEKQVIDEGIYQTCEESLVIDGRERYLETVRFPLFDYQGAVSGVASISRDITEHKHLERELIQSEKLAAVGKLAAGVAHELNNPLTGILTFTEDLLLEATGDDPRREDYELVLRETMRCRQIVRDLLDYSRMDRPRRAAVDLNGVVARSLALVGKQAVFKDIRFDLDLGDDLPPVNADPNQMQQVVVNLVINAADAMRRKGTIRIETHSGNGTKAVTLSVADTGCGIPEDKRQQIFEPFYSTKGADGNGLGLPVVARIVEQHAGQIRVESDVGTGSTFTIALPAANKG